MRITARYGTEFADARSTSLSELVSALSFALDLTEGAVAGHALRSCLIGMRIARAIGMGKTQRRNLYYALLLKDIGCSSNASRMCAIVGGDDIAVKAVARLEDWTRPHRTRVPTLRLLWKEVLPGAGWKQKAGRMVTMARTQHKNNAAMIQLRCERGAEIMRKLGMGSEAAEAVRALDEHWDGSGYPERLRGVRIPLLSRICLLAQSLDLFCHENGPARAMRMVERWSGHWFDPRLVRAARGLLTAGTLFEQCLPDADVEETRAAVMALDDHAGRRVAAGRIDRICEAFSDVVDAKSPFTFRHSARVAAVAGCMAEALAMNEEQKSLVRRAALLHDIGKLSVPNSILDNPGRLSEQDWQCVKRHPELTRRILERVPAFREVAVVAGEHHERLDGSGYPLGLQADALGLASRVIAVADTFDAMVEDRSYRTGLGLEKTLGLMREMVPGRLDARCFEALVESVRQRTAGALPLAG